MKTRGRTELPESIFHNIIGLRVEESVFTRLHVVTRLLVIMCLAIGAAFANTITSSLILASTCLILLLISKTPIRAIGRYLVVVLSILCFIVLGFTVFTYTPGNVTYWEVTILRVGTEKGVWEWKIALTDKALEYSLTFIFRMLAMVLSSILLFTTISDRDLVWGLRSIGVPSAISIAMAIFLRGIALFVEDYRIVREALMARGVDVEKASIIEKFKIYSTSLVPLIMLMIKRSYEFSMALEAKGVKLGFKRRRGYRVYSLRKIDAVAMMLTISLLLLYVSWSTGVISL